MKFFPITKYNRSHKLILHTRLHYRNGVLVVEPNLPDLEILFSCVCTLGVLYTHSPCLGVRGSSLRKGVHGQRPQEMGVRQHTFWDVCWPTVLRTHGIGLTIVFSHGISPIKESIVTWLCMVLFCIVNNLFDCVEATVRAWRGSATTFLQVVSLHLSGQ